MSTQSSAGDIPTASPPQLPAPISPPQPNTFQELQDLLYPTSESLVLAARRIAALQSISLTLTHKSRNTPGLAPAQYRGCVVLTCISVEGCSFEWKGYGPIDGGWRMRPLQLPTLKKHTVTSWCLCNHPKVPLRIPHIPLLPTWTELVKTPFDYPDDFIECATRLANSLNVSVYLLALNLADGKPKKNGRGDATYIPRGFLTLSCVESENGCPFEIKAREEENGWFMRPWREKGKEIKGAASTMAELNGGDADLSPSSSEFHPAAAEAKAAYELRKMQKKSKSSKKEDQDGIPNHSHAHNQQQQQHNAFIDPAFLGQLEGIQYVPNPTHQNYQPIASTSNTLLPLASFEPFRTSLGPYNTNIDQLGQQPQQLALSSPIVSPLKQNGKRSTDGADLPVSKKGRSNRGSPRSITPNLSPAQAQAQSGLRATWQSFLTKLDPLGRLGTMESAFVEGGIDPKAVMEWPEADRNAFIEAVAGDIPVGIRMHFKIQLGKVGERFWEEGN